MHRRQLTIAAAGGRQLIAGHTYQDRVESYQAPALEAAGALGDMSGGSWRMLLLGGAAAGALSFGISRESHAAPDACVITGGGTIATCTGNQSAGVYYNVASGVTTLNVNTLNQNITPAANQHGVRLLSGGAATINTNLPPYSIITSGGAPGNGVTAISGGAGAATINHTGDITAANGGLFARAYGGGATIDSTGNITAGGNGIVAGEIGGGTINVTHTGNVTAGGVGVQSRLYTASANNNTVTTNGTITSTANHAIYAQHQGTGAITVTHSGGALTGELKGIFANSTGGAVTVDATGNITATTEIGIDAQTAGAAAVMVTHTGGTITSRGDGIEANSTGGNVTVNNTGGITSTFSMGIEAGTNGAGTVTVTQTGDIQSVNRGVSASTVTGDLDVTVTGTVTSTNSNGINARASGAGAVTVTQNGAVTADDTGIYGRSVGGGVTVNSTGNITASDGIDVNGNGGATTVTSTGNITATSRGIDVENTTGTIGITSTGNVSASQFGIVAATTAEITVTSTGTVTSANSVGLFANAGGANNTTVTQTGNVQANLDGVYANSAGGQVTVNVTGNVTSNATDGIDARNTTGDTNVTVTGDVQGSSYGVRGRSATGGITLNVTGNVTATVRDGLYARATGAGVVNVTHTGNLTAGDEGIFAQSEGGGVTVNSTGTIDTSGGGEGIYARDRAAGAVSVTRTGDTTAGDFGINARSQGGGGPVTVVNTGAITSTGSGGIYAQSLGAGAVNVTQTGDITAQAAGVSGRSTAGGVTITTTGNITSTGAIGISTLETTGNIAVTVGGGTVTGPTAGVFLSGGTNNMLTNLASGTITSAGNAVQSTTGNDTVNNSGIVTGNVDLGTGTNAFNNLAGSTFNSGATANLGAGNALINSGNLSPGGLGTIQTTALTGNQVQNAGGTTTIDVNMAAMTNDQVTVTGTAILAGSVTLNLINVTDDTKTITVQTSTGGNTDNGLTLNAPAAVQGALVVNANNVQVTFNVNFNAPGSDLSPNQEATATTLNEILTTGAPGAQELLTALANLPVGAFGDALDQLSPGALGSLSFGNLLASLGFTDNALSCKAAAGMYAFVNEAQCVWVRPGARRFSQDRQDDGSSLGFSETALGLSAGAQAALDRDQTWIVGLSAGYEHVDLEGNSGRSIVSGDRFQGGAVLKHLMGPLLLAGGVSGGYGLFDSTRTISFAGFNGVAEGDFDGFFVNGRLRAAYLFEGPSGQQADWYVKPAVDVDFTWQTRSGFTESGASGANLSIAREEQFNIVVSPSIEFGAELGIGTAKARPFLRVGAQVFTNNENDVTASFAAGSPNFTVTSETDRVFGTVSTGVDVVHEKALSLKLQYDGKFSGNSRSHAIGAKFSWRF